MNDRNCSSLFRRRKALLVWISFIFFTSLCFAESTHRHLKSGPSEQHCSLCITAHSVARPAQVVSTSSAPTRCIAVLSVAGQPAPEFESILSLYIRPPPAA